MPKRIQYKRGMKLPPNTVYVARPSKWGNPYTIGKDGTREEVIEKYKFTKGISFLPTGWYPDVARTELKGKDLACYCKLTEACHADILLKIANDPA